MTVEKASEILSDVGDINRCCAEDAEALDMAIKALEQTRWIPVSERLPEEEGNYLVYYNDGYIAVSEWHPNPYEKICFDLLPSLIVAWMPLPPSYEPQESEGEDDRH